MTDDVSDKVHPDSLWPHSGHLDSLWPNGDCPGPGMPHPVSDLREALAGLMALIEDGALVRNTANDDHFPSYISESTRLVKALAAAWKALGPESPRE